MQTIIQPFETVDAALRQLSKRVTDDDMFNAVLLRLLVAAGWTLSEFEARRAGKPGAFVEVVGEVVS